MNPFKILHLLIAFLLEIGMLVALGYWGFQKSESQLLKYTLVIGIPLVAAVLWGILAAPRSQYRLQLPFRLAFAFLLYSMATIALYQTGHTLLSITFLCMAILSLATEWRIG